MALAYSGGAGFDAAPLYGPDASLSRNESGDVRMYRKFVAAARIGAISTPVFLAFVLFWMR